MAAGAPSGTTRAFVLCTFVGAPTFTHSLFSGTCTSLTEAVARTDNNCRGAFGLQSACFDGPLTTPFIGAIAWEGARPHSRAAWDRARTFTSVADNTLSLGCRCSSFMSLPTMQMRMNMLVTACESRSATWATMPSTRGKKLAVLLTKSLSADPQGIS